MQDSMGEVTQITSEAIKGYKVIRTFNAEQMVNDKLASASDAIGIRTWAGTGAQLGTPLVQMIVAMGLAFLV